MGNVEVSKIESEIRKLKPIDSYIKTILTEAASPQNHAAQRNHNDEQAAKDYAEVITLMKWAEIEVYYAVGGTEDFGRDFALVDVGEKRWIVMEWIHSHHRGPVDECVFHDWADEKFHSRWTNLFMRACSYGQLVGLSDETIQRDAAE